MASPLKFILGICIMQMLFGMATAQYQPDDLIAAVKANDLALVNTILATNLDPDRTDSLGLAPILWATVNNFPDIITALIDGGASPDAVFDGNPAINWAIFHDHSAAALALLEGGANANLINIDGDSPLLLAVAYGRLEIVNYLLLHNAYAEYTNPNNGNTPFLLAFQYNHGAILDSLLTASSSLLNYLHTFVDSSGYTWLHYAVFNNVVNIAGVMIIHNIDDTLKDVNGGFALMYVVLGENLAMLDAFISSNANLDTTIADGSTAMMYAIANGYYDIAEALAKGMADPNIQNANGDTATALAAFYNQPSIVYALTQNPVTDLDIVNSAGISPLMIGAASGYDEIVYNLLNNPPQNNIADPDILDKDGTPAIVYACNLGHIIIIQYLIAAGASLAYTNTDQNTCLHLAALGGNYEMCYVLTEEGDADPNVVTDTGDTPLMYAVVNGSLETVECLILANANLDLQETVGGYTALIGAIVLAYTDIFLLLLNQGADGTKVNFAGQSPGMIAASLDMADITTKIYKKYQDVDGYLDLQDDIGQTALMYATTADLEYTFQAIIYFCPNTSIADENGTLPIEKAEENGNERMINLLTVMENPTCFRFFTKYYYKQVIYQNCEKLECHCIGTWKLVGRDTETCGKGEQIVLSRQRVVCD